jgi:hypothetical protein
MNEATPNLSADIRQAIASRSVSSHYFAGDLEGVSIHLFDDDRVAIVVACPLGGLLHVGEPAEGDNADLRMVRARRHFSTLRATFWLGQAERDKAESNNV